MPAARRWAADLVQSWGCDDLVDSVRLVVSELVGNAVLHARTELELTLVLEAEVLRVSVRDRCTASVERSRPETNATHGRGLGLVECCSDRWGQDVSDAGKTVWAEWARTRGADGSDRAEPWSEGSVPSAPRVSGRRRRGRRGRLQGQRFDAGRGGHD